jgi:PAS domain S-box-containing protein
MVHEIPGKDATAADPQRFEHLLDGVRDYAILLLDIEGRVLSWNDGATLLFGYHASEVIGQSFSRFFIPEEIGAGRPEVEVRQATASGQVTREGWQVRRDGTRFWGSSVITALRDERGELKGFAKVIRDTTDRKQLEMELRRQAEELAEANRRKDEFLAMLSHELRNPLAPVLNSVHVLRLAPDDPSLVQFAGNMVERQVRHMARLIDDLLDVTRLTHGKVRLRPERVELGAVAQRAAEAVGPLMVERSHHFHLVRPDRPIWMEADPIGLDQVFTNLLNNAAEFTDPGGHIQMIVGRDDEGHAVIRIRDDGTGIAPELLPRVFDLFTQADTSLDRCGGGLGIGLTLVKRLVTMHAGTIEVLSEGPGRGSEFTVRLPTLPDPPDEPRTLAEPDPASSLRILVVDDNVDTAMSLSILLQLHGHAVEMAHDGAAAVELSAAHAFDVIMLDIGLPSFDGYEVARRIRARGSLPRPLLVGISGYGFDADHRRAQDAGFDLYLVKPVDPQLLEKLVEQWSRKRQVSEASTG